MHNVELFKEYGPEIFKILTNIDDIEILLAKDSTTMQLSSSGVFLLLAVLPIDRVKDILKSAKLLRNGDYTLDAIKLTAKEWETLKEFEKSADVVKTVDRGKDVGKVGIPEKSLKHADVGDFTVNPATGKVSKMKGGGHGQSNIDFLKENGFEVNVKKTYPNGVRTGNVPHHKTPSKRTGTGQAWFPENWTNRDIERAGQQIANQPNFARATNGEVIFEDYNGVRVGVIKTEGKIGTIFPDGTKQP
ncbi:EndoU domain-containing protein [Enterococcus wangshanyuanii]|uniref:Bacterial EndoU nuclease domain-containing protein n=1 Tax=Enterococcus wangshanyuanii TaxID=2005703 RepID=A0ABQ1P3X8_9ENTE|nr:EndoU domain-containing protein [Enterococcus wangshanyuanii]GGC90479.1 hypothetical protein GCM10011573_20180 [Enterococcus wangshanyuanii]